MYNRIGATAIGFIFQTFSLVPTLSAADNVEAALVPLLEKLWRGRGLTLVLVTRDSAPGRRAQRLAVMRNGQLQMAGQRGSRATAP